jgi:predicted ABC-class ATPase
VKRTAMEDLLIRRIADRIDQLATYDSEGISRRRISIAAPGQKILPRTSLVITDEYLEARLYIDFPQRDGVIPGDALKTVFFDDLPGIVNAAMLYCNLDEREVEEAVSLMEDADQVRQVLSTRGLIGFVAEGSLLGRISGTDLPDYEQLMPLAVDESCAVDIDVPNAGSMRGLGVSAGVTVVLGSEYSGRCELMKALASGIYNHMHGDGRELAITVSDAVYVAAEPGRSVQRVDLSAFAEAIPSGGDVRDYSSESADSFASQAAGLVESLEVGARVLLFDEADSAPAFLTRDERLAGLVGGADTTIPLVARVRSIADELGVSVVVGGSTAVAEFITEADTVLRVDNFEIKDVTQEAKAAFKGSSANDWPPADVAGLVEKMRWIVPSSIDPSVGKHDAFIEAPERDWIEFGRSLVDLQSVVQLADVHQTETVGQILYYAKLRYLDEGRPIREVLDLVDRDLSTEGLECLTRELRGDLARPRRYEIAAVLNRLDTLRIAPPTE